MKMHPVYYKQRGIGGYFLDTEICGDELTVSRMDDGEKIEAIYDHFNGNGRFPKGFGQWFKDCPSFAAYQSHAFYPEEWSEKELNAVIAAVESWSDDSGRVLPCHWFICNDRFIGFAFIPEWLQSFADVYSEYPEKSGRGQFAVINERGNVSFYVNGKELFSYV